MNRSQAPVLTPEEESKFWERVGVLLGEEDSPEVDSESVIYYDPEIGVSRNKS